MDTKKISANNDKVFQVANYFIKKAQENNKSITNKKLQKLLYYAQAWSWTLRNQKMFDQDIEAWIHGPAIPIIYQKYMQFGPDDFVNKFSTSDLKISDLSEQETEFLDEVWDIYGKYNANDLEILSHSEAPWQEARQDLQPFESSNNVISLASMKKYYGEK